MTNVYNFTNLLSSTENGLDHVLIVVSKIVRIFAFTFICVSSVKVSLSIKTYL